MDQAIEQIEGELPLSQPEPSLRDQIEKAVEEVKTKEPEVKKADKPRAEDGKFVKNAAPEKKIAAQQKQVNQTDETVARETEIKAPKSYSAAVMGKWKELPREIQQELVKREDDTHKTLAAQDEDRLFGKQIRDKANPYLAIIRAEGGDIGKAFDEFLNTAYLLRNESPQNKGRLLLHLAQTYGADLRGATQAQPNVDPRFNQVLQEVQSLKSVLQQQEGLKKQTEESELKRQIDAFAADPEHEHFETVKAEMASFLKSGIAQDLQDAYERAVYANPQTRSTLLEQQNVQVQEKRVAEQKARADAARKAGSSIKGSPGMAASKNGKIEHKDLRSTIEAAFAEHRGEA